MEPHAARFRVDLERLTGGAPDRLALAVSGGADSLALLLLGHAAFPGRVHAATVDHGLRAEAAEEAAFVAGICARLGIPHATLAAKMAQSVNIQAEARTRRYALLGDWARSIGADWLATAHHLDDQAETLLMRLQRGSGVAGLAGIRPVHGADPPVVRPLLGWRREELAEIVAAAGIAPVVDPSNADARFDRVRIRAHLAANPWLDPVPFARSAAGLAEAEAALIWAADRAWDDHVDGGTLNPAGLPAEIRRRLVVRLLAQFGGPAPRGEEVGRLLATLEGGGTATLAGVKCVGGPVWRFAAAPPRTRWGRSARFDSARHSAESGANKEIVMTTTRAWHLMSRPQGMPTMDNFALKEVALPELQDGWVRVDNRWLSVDPYMRGRMNDVKSYVPPFALGEPMQGGAVGKVVESRSPTLAVGDTVFHMLGWRETAAGPAEAFNKVPPIPVDDEHWLGNLGLTGATGYFGLLRVAEAKEGDTVFVSAAAGAVGSAVVQIAKAKGMTVIGAAGGAEKCEWVRSLGADAALDYKSGPILKLLMEAAPKGIDVYFDNVGGDHLDAALATARQNARFAICGMIEDYNTGSNHAFRFITRIIAARIMIKGFIYTDYLPEMAAFYRDMGGWIAGGQVTSRETVREGIEAAPQAFLDLFTGGNIGKMLVKI